MLIHRLRYIFLAIIVLIGTLAHGQNSDLDPTLNPQIKLVKQAGDYTGYAYDKEFVYAFRPTSKRSNIERKADYYPIEGSHGSSFKYLGRYHARDKNQAYYWKKPIPKSHGPTFKHFGNGFSRDKHRWYFNGLVIDFADYETFNLHGVSGYVSDKDGAYYFNRFQWVTDDSFKYAAVKDVESFEYLKGDYARDKHGIYFKGVLLEGISAEASIIFNPWDWTGFVSDGTAIFFIEDKGKVSRRPEIDLASFEIINPCCPADSVRSDELKCSFLRDSLPFSYEHTQHNDRQYSCGHYAIDKNAVYYIHTGKKLEADRATFEDLDYSYARDKDHVYYEDKILKDVDPNQFKTTGWYTGEDDQYVYRQGRIERKK